MPRPKAENLSDNPQQDELLAFFKALADANRLKIIGLLATQELSVEQLAEMLQLRASTVSHHLARLSEAGLVEARAESYYNIYRMQADMLEKMAARILAPGALPQMAREVDANAYDQKILQNYLLPDGRIKTLPNQLKKFEAILRYVVQDFVAGEIYTEKQVNAVLSRYHADTAALRRGLIETKMLQRANDGSSYWRSATPAQDAE